jgi:hypothetical protein
MTGDDHYQRKQLRLVPMDVANALGVPAESPVFISSKIDKPERCGRCGVIYGPLVYQTGHISSPCATARKSTSSTRRCALWCVTATSLSPVACDHVRSDGRCGVDVCSENQEQP